MELSDVVDLFTTELFSDAVGDDDDFNGKLTVFNEITNSGSSAERTILETSISAVIPTSRVIRAVSGDLYIVGQRHADLWQGEAIRHKYPVLLTDLTADVGTIGETLAGTQPDTGVHCYPFFLGQRQNKEERSDSYTRFEIRFPKIKHFASGDIVKVGTSYYRLRTATWEDSAGFSTALAILLENTIQSLTVVNYDHTDYDPTTDTLDSTTIPAVTCFVEPMPQDYEFKSPAFKPIEPGDKAISVLKSVVALGVNDKIGEYTVIAVSDHGTWVTAHGRYIGS